MNAISSLLALIGIVATLSTASALRCYVCNSVVDPSCENDPNDGHIQNCSTLPYPSYPVKMNQTEVDDEKSIPEEEKKEMKKRSLNESRVYTLCRKSYQSIYDKVRVFRSCGFIAHKKPCYYTVGHKLQNTVCECTEDACNEAPASLTFNSVLLLLSAIMSFVVIHG